MDLSDSVDQNQNPVDPNRKNQTVLDFYNNFIKEWKLASKYDVESYLQNAATTLFYGIKMHCEHHLAQLKTHHGLLTWVTSNTATDLFGSTVPNACIILGDDKRFHYAAPFVMGVKPKNLPLGYAEALSTCLLLTPVTNWKQVFMSLSCYYIYITFIDANKPGSVASVKSFSHTTVNVITGLEYTLITAEELYEHFDKLLSTMYPQNTLLSETRPQGFNPIDCGYKPVPGFSRVNYYAHAHKSPEHPFDIVIKRHVNHGNGLALSNYVNELYFWCGLSTQRTLNLKGLCEQVKTIELDNSTSSPTTSLPHGFFISTIPSVKANKQEIASQTQKTNNTNFNQCKEDTLPLAHYTVPKFEGSLTDDPTIIHKYLPFLLAVVFCMNCHHNDIRLPNIVLACDDGMCLRPDKSNYIKPSNDSSIPLALIDFEYIDVELKEMENLVHYQAIVEIVAEEAVEKAEEEAEVNGDINPTFEELIKLDELKFENIIKLEEIMEDLKLDDFFFINVYSCLHAAGVLRDSLDIKYFRHKGFICSSTDNDSLTKIVTIANEWIDALCKIFNKNTKQSIYRKISPGELFSLYLKQQQNNSLVCISPPNKHSNTQLPQNNDLDSSSTTNKRAY